MRQKVLAEIQVALHYCIQCKRDDNYGPSQVHVNNLHIFDLFKVDIYSTKVNEMQKINGEG